MKAARYLRDRVVEVEFADGLVREVDIAPFMQGPIWDGWHNPEAFRRLAVVGGTLAWPDGPDIAPETLYYGLGPITAALG